MITATMSQRYFLIIALILMAACLIPRVFDLDKFLTADERRWATNTDNFTRALAQLKWDETLQQAHPGIITQWLGALTIHSPSWATRKLPLVIGQGILIFAIGYVFWLFHTRALPAIVLVLLLCLNPFLIAHTRVYAMDSLLALFLLLSVSLLFLWNKTRETRYLVFAGAAGAAAWLSKLPGILIVPFSLVFLVFSLGKFSISNFQFSNKSQFSIFKLFLIWLLVFFSLSILILPALATNTYNALQDILAFFSSDDYQILHPAQASYYLGTLLFFSTPVQMFALGILIWSAVNSIRRGAIDRVLGSMSRTPTYMLWLLLFAVLFFLMMSLGAKKGDRYLLPIFVFWDAISAVVIASVLDIRSLKIDWKLLRPPKLYAKVGVVILLLWQIVILYQLHPYYLSYVNPLTKPFFSERRLGWGEGLDLAAEYLNQKPVTAQIKVAAYYPNEFAYRFNGEVVPAHQWEEDSVDYVVLYRAMFDRGPEAWETDVLEHFKQKTPEKLIKLNGLDYVWVYRK